MEYAKVDIKETAEELIEQLDSGNYDGYKCNCCAKYWGECCCEDVSWDDGDTILMKLELLELREKTNTLKTN